VRVLMRRNRLDLLMLSWFLVMFISINAATHKEARYLLSTAPPFFYFVVAAIDWLWIRTQSYSLKVAVVSLLLVMPVALGVRELDRFNDPVYSQPLLREVAATISAQ